MFNKQVPSKRLLNWLKTMGCPSQWAFLITVLFLEVTQIFKGWSMPCLRMTMMSYAVLGTGLILELTLLMKDFRVLSKLVLDMTQRC